MIGSGLFAHNVKRYTDSPAYHSGYPAPHSSLSPIPPPLWGNRRECVNSSVCSFSEDDMVEDSDYFTTIYLPFPIKKPVEPTKSAVKTMRSPPESSRRS